MCGAMLAYSHSPLFSSCWRTILVQQGRMPLSPPLGGGMALAPLLGHHSFSRGGQVVDKYRSSAVPGAPDWTNVGCMPTWPDATVTILGRRERIGFIAWPPYGGAKSTISCAWVYYLNPRQIRLMLSSCFASVVHGTAFAVADCEICEISMAGAREMRNLARAICTRHWWHQHKEFVAPHVASLTLCAIADYSVHHRLTATR